MAKPKITKIKASDNKKPAPEAQEKIEKTERIEKKSDKNIKKSGEKKPFFFFRPFIALGHYFRDSWRELRQVRWPSGKATWKLVLAVIIYSAIIMGFITLLDMLFSYLSNIILA